MKYKCICNNENHDDDAHFCKICGTPINMSRYKASLCPHYDLSTEHCLKRDVELSTICALCCYDCEEREIKHCPILCEKFM